MLKRFVKNLWIMISVHVGRTFYRRKNLGHVNKSHYRVGERENYDRAFVDLSSFASNSSLITLT